MSGGTRRDGARTVCAKHRSDSGLQMVSNERMYNGKGLVERTCAGPAILIPVAVECRSDARTARTS